MNNYYIIDQINPYTGTFDEHKLVKGANIKNAVEAALIYLSNYEPNWQGLGAISKVTPHIYDLWLKYGNRKQPFSNSDFAEKPLHLALVGDAAPDPSKSRHWITTETGSHILINGNGEVVAGAGGKLAGKKFNVPAGSKDVSKHIETVEKIAQAGYEKHGGDKAEYLRMGRNKGSSAYFAREYEKKGIDALPEGHLREALVDKPKEMELTTKQKAVLNIGYSKEKPTQEDIDTLVENGYLEKKGNKYIATQKAHELNDKENERLSNPKNQKEAYSFHKQKLLTDVLQKRRKRRSEQKRKVYSKS